MIDETSKQATSRRKQHDRLQVLMTILADPEGLVRELGQLKDIINVELDWLRTEKPDELRREAGGAINFRRLRCGELTFRIDQDGDYTYTAWIGGVHQVGKTMLERIRRALQLADLEMPAIENEL